MTRRLALRSATTTPLAGGPAVSAVVNDFYERVLGDPQLVPYFEGVDMARLKRHQVLLVTQVLGGPGQV